MATLMQTSPAHLITFLERLVHDPLFSESLSKREARMIVQRLWNFYCYGYVAFASPSPLESSQWEDVALPFAVYYRSGSWARRFDVLVHLTSSHLFPIKLLPKVHKILMSSKHAAAVDQKSLPEPDDQNKFVRSAIVEFWPSLNAKPQVFIRFKKDSTLSTYERNRLCRRFGGDKFLVVRFITPSATIWDKQSWATGPGLSSDDQTQPINGARLFNLFANLDDKDGTTPIIPVRPSLLGDSACVESHGLAQQLRQVLETFTSRPLMVAGMSFKFFITTAAGIHVQKYIYTAEEPETVLNWAMSDSDANKLRSSPIKLALRLALLNSTSIATCTATRVTVVPDITAEGATAEQAQEPEFIMTDGCGKISVSFAIRVMDEYNQVVRHGAPRTKVPKAAIYEDEDSTGHLAVKSASFRLMDKLPSAFQIRYGGCKGMLVATPDEQMDGYDIIFTESMHKFSAPEAEEHRLLEIMGFSWSLTDVTTNTEILDVLWGSTSDHETLKDYMLGLLQSMLKKHDALLEDRDEAVQNAIKSGDSLSLQLLAADFSPDIAYLVGCYRATLRPLHIPIPDSCRLYGVADWQRILEPGHVYLNVNGTVVTGPLLVLKEPCFQASDVQHFEAVDIPELSHLRDILVFSTKGTLSPASTMAGSDLDGDKFVCIWNRTLQPLIQPRPFPLPNGASSGPTATTTDSSLSSSSSAGPYVRDQHNEAPSSIFDAVRRACIETVHGESACSFTDLLGLRVCLIDHCGRKWPDDRSARHLSQLLSQAVDAPKKGNQVSLAEVAPLLADVPEFPHYHPRATSLSVYRNPDSLRAVLHDHILGHLKERLQYEAVGTEGDFVQFHQAILLHKGSTGDEDEEASSFQEAVLELEHQVEERGNLIEIIAFYSRYWKYARQCASSQLRQFQDRRCWQEEAQLAPTSSPVRLTFKNPQYVVLPTVRHHLCRISLRRRLTLDDVSSFSSTDGRWPFLVLHAFRDENFFTPAYRIQTLLQRCWHRLLANHQVFSLNRDGDRVVEPLQISREHLQRFLQRYQHRLQRHEKHNWHNVELDQVNRCLAYLHYHPPTGNSTSYECKHAVEKSEWAGYVTNESAIVAAVLLGYAAHLLWDSGSAPELNPVLRPSCFPLRLQLRPQHKERAEETKEATFSGGINKKRKREHEEEEADDDEKEVETVEKGKDRM